MVRALAYEKTSMEPDSSVEFTEDPIGFYPPASELGRSIAEQKDR